MAVKVADSASLFLMEQNGDVVLLVEAVLLNSASGARTAAPEGRLPGEQLVPGESVLVFDDLEEPHRLHLFQDEYIAIPLTNDEGSQFEAELAQLKLLTESISDNYEAALSDQGAVDQTRKRLDDILTHLTGDNPEYETASILVDDVSILLEHALDQMEEEAQLILDAADIAINQIQDVKLKLVSTPRKVTFTSVLAGAFLLVAFQYGAAALVGDLLMRGLRAWKRTRVSQLVTAHINRKLLRNAGLENRLKLLGKELHGTLRLRDATQRHLNEARVLARAARYSRDNLNVATGLATRGVAGRIPPTASARGRMMLDALENEVTLSQHKQKLNELIKGLEKELNGARQRFARFDPRTRIAEEDVEKLLGLDNLETLLPNVAKFVGTSAKDTAAGMGKINTTAGASEVNGQGDSVSSLFRIQILRVQRATLREIAALRRQLDALRDLAQSEETALPAALNGFAHMVGEILWPMRDMADYETALRELALDFEFSLWAWILPDLKLNPTDPSDVFDSEDTLTLKTPNDFLTWIEETFDDPQEEFRVDSNPGIGGLTFVVPGVKTQMLDYFSQRFSAMLGITPAVSKADKYDEAKNSRKLIFFGQFADAIRDRRAAIKKGGLAALQAEKTAKKDVIKVEIDSLVYPASFLLVRNKDPEPPANN